MQLRNSPLLASVLCASLLQCGCTGFVIHDEARATIAAGAKQNYTDANVSQIADAERKNLDLLLAAEIKAVRDSYRIQVDYAALELANNATPMTGTYFEATERLGELGVPSVGALKSLLKDDNARRNAQNSLGPIRKFFASRKVTAPQCAKDMPNALVLPEGVSDPGGALVNQYRKYKDLCKLLTDTELDDGRLKAARDEWVEAKSALDNAKNEQKAAQDALQRAKGEYDVAAGKLAAAGNRSEALAAEISDAAGKLADALKAAKKLNAGVENDEQIGAIVDLLTAAAGGEVNPADPDVARAATIARQLPSLAGDIAELEARRVAPPVSGLLLALQHQTILAEGAKARASLAEQRVAILKARYDAYYAEAERWFHFTDAMCAYAMRGLPASGPVLKCETFGLNEKKECVYGDAAVAGCRLGFSWKDRIRASEQSDLRRELYKAAAAYFQALALQSAPLEESFREIDVRHRETLLAKRNAIEQWDNLVSVPLEQLDGYYKSGVKPAEIADLLVKALGFTAIAIGVSK